MMRYERLLETCHAAVDYLLVLFLKNKKMDNKNLDRLQNEYKSLSEELKDGRVKLNLIMDEIRAELQKEIEEVRNGMRGKILRRIDGNDCWGTIIVVSDINATWQSNGLYEWTLIGKKYTYDFDAKLCNVNGDYWDNNCVGVSREFSIPQFKKFLATEFEELSETDFQKIMDKLVKYFFKGGKSHGK